MYLNIPEYDQEMIKIMSYKEYCYVINFLINNEWISDNLIKLGFKKDLNNKILNIDEFKFKFFNKDIRHIRIFKNNVEIGYIFYKKKNYYIGNQYLYSWKKVKVLRGQFK